MARAYSNVIRGGHVGLQRPISLTIKPPSPSVEDSESDQPKEDPTPEIDVAALVEKELEEARTRGYEEGFAAGVAAGRQAVEEAAAEEVARLASMAATVIQSNEGFFRAAERQVIDLALHIARKVVEYEVESVPDLAVRVIRGTLEEMDARTAVRIHVSPEDEEILTRRWAEAIPAALGVERAELVVDPHVQSGGAVIETAHGQVDAQLQTRLTQLASALWTYTASPNEEPDAGTDAID